MKKDGMPNIKQIAGEGSTQIVNIGVKKEIIQQIVEQAKDEILKQVVDSGSGVMSSITDAGDSIVETLSNIIRNKAYELILNIDGRFSKTEDSIKTAIQSNVDAIKNDFTPLISNIKQDIISVYEDLKKTVDQHNERLNQTFDRLSRRYEYYYQRSQNQYISLLVAINKLVPNYEIEFNLGMKCIEDANFETAQKLLDKVTAQNNLKSYAYFGLALAEYHVQVIWDYQRDQWQPILHNYSRENKLFDCAENISYQAALQSVNGDTKLYNEYKRFAERIDGTLKTYWSYIREENVLSDDMVSFGRDCFISVKVTDPQTGQDTDDCSWIINSGLYEKLKKKNLRPFFSRKDIEENAPDDVYEAKILYALNKAQCLVLVCSDPTYLSTPWVKNEYTRFLNKLKVDKRGLNQDQLMIICDEKFIDISELRLPFEHTQYCRSQHTVDQLVKEIEKKVDKASGSADESSWYCSECGYPHGKGFGSCSRAGCDGKVVDALTYVNIQNTKKNAQIQKLENEKEALLEQVGALESEKQQAEKAKQLVEQEWKDVAADKKSLEKLKKEFSKQQKDAQKELDRQQQELKEQEESIFGRIRELESIRQEILNGGNLTPEQLEKVKVTLENYDKEEFEIEGTVLLRYIGRNDNIIIPDGVMEIGKGAFSEIDVYSITIPKSVKHIGKGAFSNSTVRRVYIEDLSAWCAIKYDTWEADWENKPALFNCYYSLYLNHQLVTELIIPQGVTSIDNGLFSGCVSIRSVFLPDSVESIGDVSFKQCIFLQSVTIPHGVNRIGLLAFADCSLLKNIYIDDISAWCKIKHESSHVLNAFNNVKYVLFVNGQFCCHFVIPDDVTQITADTFYGCQSIYDITIPSSVKCIIGQDVFAECSSLKELIYKGTKAQWKAIKKRDDCGEGYVCCTDGSILINENSDFDIEGTVLIKYNGRESVVVIPDRVTHIANGAFVDCASFLKRVVLPVNLETIGDNAFGFNVEQDVGRVKLVQSGQKITIVKGKKHGIKKRQQNNKRR